MKRVALAVALLIGLAVPAWADFQAGLAAYQRGDGGTSMVAWKSRGGGAMQISCQGWRRQLWNHQICDLDLSKGLDQYGHDFQQNDIGLKVRWTSNVRLSGDYVFVARFTKEDVARLFVEAFSDATVGDVLSMLAEAHTAQAGS